MKIDAAILCFTVVVCLRYCGSCGAEPITTDARPIWQVLDETPPDLMLNYFVRIANERADRHRLPGSASDWNSRATQLRKQLRQTLGNFPWNDRPPLRAQVTGRLDHGDHVVEKIRYESLPGLYVTALAYVPKNLSQRSPAVVCVNGHWPEAKSTDHIQQRCMALARLGVIAFCQDVIGTGERQAYAGSPPQNYHGFYRGATPRLVDRSLLGYVIFECSRALDYLLSRDDVDPSRIMCTGASGGGKQSMFFAALDQRLAGAIPVCYISSYEAHMGATACVGEIPAGILNYSNQWEILALHAPRPLFCIAAARDVPVFQPRHMLSTLAETRSVYEMMGAKDQVTSAVVDSKHDYNQEMRELMYRHVAQHLLSLADADVSEPHDLPVESAATLRVGLPADSQTMQSLTYRRACELTAQIKLPMTQDAWRTFRVEMHDRLRNVVMGDTPDVIASQKSLRRRVTANGQVVEHWVLEPEPGILVPAVLSMSASASEVSERPAVLVVDEEGKQLAFERGLADELVAAGYVVLAIDYRGAGETAGTVPAIAYGPGTPEYNLSNYSLLNGRPLVGARLLDIRAATDLLASRAEVDASKISIVGRGRGALAAVLAATFDDRLGAVVAEELLASWVFDQEFVDIGLAYFVPRILTVGDMPHLLALIAPRRLLVVNPVDGRRRAVSIESAKRQLQFTSSGYELLQRPARMDVSHADPEAVVAAISSWLQREGD